MKRKPPKRSPRIRPEDLERLRRIRDMLRDQKEPDAEELRRKIRMLRRPASSK